MAEFNFTLPMTLKLRLHDEWNIRTTGRGLAEIEGGEMDVDVLAYKGDPGDAGRDGTPVQIHRAQIPADIPAIGSLSPEWIGHGWRVDGSRDVKMVVEEYPGGPVKFDTLTNYLGDKGDTGAVPTLAVRSVTSTTEGNGSVEFEEISPGAYAADFVLRKGDTGAPSTVPGPAAAVEAATDYEDDDTAAVTGDVLAKRSDGKWGPRKIFQSPGVYKKAGSAEDWLAVNSGNGWAGEYVSIVTMPMPAQPFAWEPEVDGMVEFFTTANVRIDLECRLGAVSGPLLARGPAIAITSFQNQWIPRVLSRAAEETISVPTSSSTIVPKNTAVNIFLIARKIETTAQTRLETRKERAYLRVRPIPVSV
ncbi:hypothetical protein CH296_27895 [Rhodococcus sp. 14-2496-1d]|uniref:hypothetical protein n=2 Tax=unclassified Rhodococcus (in: high G+C Gram-positive bacteria) TaxID=192944 RepID=UPI000B9B5C7C|nr:hypothetical protein [Rhodococcus sp. 14-2496-1d]OZF25207.1 hypothetical protein CH296_27895 [Rhodococcus sp. 14-2496-1d]